MTFPYPLQTRSDWGARPLPRLTEQSPAREVFIHHTASKDAGRIESLAQMRAAVKAIEHHHIDVNGWSYIGYHFVVFEPNARHPNGVIFACRPINRVPAAQLRHNTKTGALAVYGNGDAARLQRHTRFVIECLIRSFFPHTTVVGGHRDVVETSCPGDMFYLDVPTIARSVGVPTYAAQSRR